MVSASLTVMILGQKSPAFKQITPEVLKDV
jgi:hypothetical protein